MSLKNALISYLLSCYIQMCGGFSSFMCAKTCALLPYFCVQPGSSGFGASAAAGARAGQGAAGQYGWPYASVYGTQQVVN